MATRKNSGNTPARPNDSLTAPSPIGAADLELEAAVAKAGAHPERAAELAEDLGLSYHDHKVVDPLSALGREAERTTSAPETVLYRALRGAGFPPPTSDDWFPDPPAGSFDAGIARVMGEQHVIDFDNWVRGRGIAIAGETPDATKDLQDEVKASFGFSRYAVVLKSAMANEDELETPEEQIESVEYELSRMAATAYLAGWRMGQEAENVRWRNIEDGKRDAR